MASAAERFIIFSSAEDHLQFRLTFVDPFEDIENCMGIRRGGAFGSPLANNLPLMPSARRNLTPEGGSLLGREQQGGTATEVEDECEAAMKLAEVAEQKCACVESE